MIETIKDRDGALIEASAVHVALIKTRADISNPSGCTRDQRAGDVELEWPPSKFAVKGRRCCLRNTGDITRRPH